MYSIVGGTTKKINNSYAIVDGQTRTVNKIYAIVGGVTKLVWELATEVLDYAFTGLLYPSTGSASGGNTAPAYMSRRLFSNGSFGSRENFNTYETSTKKPAYQAYLASKDGKTIIRSLDSANQTNDSETGYAIWKWNGTSYVWKSYHYPLRNFTKSGTTDPIPYWAYSSADHSNLSPNGKYFSYFLALTGCTCNNTAIEAKFDVPPTGTTKGYLYWVQCEITDDGTVNVLKYSLLQSASQYYYGYYGTNSYDISNITMYTLPDCAPRYVDGWVTYSFQYRYNVNGYTNQSGGNVCYNPQTLEFIKHTNFAGDGYSAVYYSVNGMPNISSNGLFATSDLCYDSDDENFLFIFYLNKETGDYTTIYNDQGTAAPFPTNWSSIVTYTYPNPCMWIDDLFNPTVMYVQNVAAGNKVIYSYAVSGTTLTYLGSYTSSLSDAWYDMSKSGYVILGGRSSSRNSFDGVFKLTCDSLGIITGMKSVIDPAEAGYYVYKSNTFFVNPENI